MKKSPIFYELLRWTKKWNRWLKENVEVDIDNYQKRNKWTDQCSKELDQINERLLQARR